MTNVPDIVDASDPAKWPPTGYVFSRYLLAQGSAHLVVDFDHLNRYVKSQLSRQVVLQNEIAWGKLELITLTISMPKWLNSFPYPTNGEITVDCTWVVATRRVTPRGDVITKDVATPFNTVLTVYRPLTPTELLTGTV